MGRFIQTYTTLQAAAAIAPVAGSAPICQINPPQILATNPMNMGLLRLRVVLTTAVQGIFGLVPAATAGTPTVPGTVIGTGASINNGGYGGGNGPGRLLTAWSVAPTIAAAPQYLEQDLLPGTIGAGFEWSWSKDDPLTRNMQETLAFFESGLILQNLNGGASPAILVTARWVEFSTVA